MREREGEAKVSISFSFFSRFWMPMAYIPVAPYSFGATGCARSRVLKIKESNLCIQLSLSIHQESRDEIRQNPLTN